MENKIIGQESLVYQLTRLFKIFYNSKGMIRPHFILTGGSGSSKTFAVECLCRELNLPLTTISAAQITAEGHSGNSISKALGPLRNIGDVPSVVFVDEFDKLFVTGNSNSESSTPHQYSVQNELLKVVESKETAVFGDYGKYVSVPVSRTLFIFAGAFNNEEDITLDRLRELGAKTEFLGRVSLVYNTRKLLLDELKEILRASELLKMYLKLFVDKSREEVIKIMDTYLEDTYETNTIGARIITSMLHSYFIRGSLQDVPMKELAFTQKMEF